MVVVLKEGDKRMLDRIKRFVCNECGCVFLANKHEYNNMSNQREGPMFSCKCPTCGKTCWNYDH